MAPKRGGRRVEADAAGDGQARVGRLTSERVWQHVTEESFAILGYVTPSGEPRTSGVLYKAAGRRLYVVADSESWKARHIVANGRVSLTVPVRRGGIMSLMAPIPPATISFPGTAVVHPSHSPQVGPIVEEMASMIPAGKRATVSVIEIVPEGTFVTFGLDVPLMKMRDSAAALARVPVAPPGASP